MLERHAAANGRAGDLVVCRNGELAVIAGVDTLAEPLAHPLPRIISAVDSAIPMDSRSTRPLPPVDPAGEVWADGVTYHRSREGTW